MQVVKVKSHQKKNNQVSTTCSKSTWLVVVPFHCVGLHIYQKITTWIPESCLLIQLVFGGVMHTVKEEPPTVLSSNVFFLHKAAAHRAGQWSLHAHAALLPECGHGSVVRRGGNAVEQCWHWPLTLRHLPVPGVWAPGHQPAGGLEDAKIQLMYRTAENVVFMKLL